MNYDIDQRKTKILELLATNGDVHVTELSRLFDVSEVTIRIDLAYLEERGLLSRVYGGAISSYKNYYNMNLKQRSTINGVEKKAIASRICDMINDNETIFFNSGTTVLYVLRVLKYKKNITVVTNSLVIASEAAGFAGFSVILLGGLLHPKYQFTYGDDTKNLLLTYHADKAILSVDGVNGQSGYSTYYPQETEICRQMLKQANTSIIAVDYTKIGRIAFSNIAPVNTADRIVTNKNAPLSEIDIIRETGVEVIIV